MLLGVMSMSRCVFTILHFHSVYKFVKSRPPGRKMVSILNNLMVNILLLVFFKVTSDINVFATFFSDLGEILTKLGLDPLTSELLIFQLFL